MFRDIIFGNIELNHSIIDRINASDFSPSSHFDHNILGFDTEVLSGLCQSYYAHILMWNSSYMHRNKILRWVPCSFVALETMKQKFLNYRLFDQVLCSDSTKHPKNRNPFKSINFEHSPFLFAKVG